MTEYLAGGLVVALAMFVMYVKAQQPTNQTNYDVKIKARQLDINGDDVEVAAPETTTDKPKKKKGIFRKLFKKKK